MTDTHTHDLALARAERDAWQTTCEELHHMIAGLTVEIESHLERIDAADQRARTLDAALAHEREAGRGLQAQVEEYRDAHGAKCDEIAKLRAEVAELRARPVLTEDLLRGALDAHGYAGLTRKLFAHLGPVTLPSPDRAEELARADYDWLNSAGDFDRCRPELQQRYTAAMRAALAKLSPAPAREAAPTLVAVSDEELVAAYYGNNAMPLDEDERAGIRAVRAKLGAAEVTEERLAAAFSVAENMTLPGARRTAANVLNRLRATAAKGG